MKKNLNCYLREMSYIRIFVLAAGILLVYKVLFDFSSTAILINQITRVISPFFSGFIIAYCLNIPCGWFEKKLSSAGLKYVDKFAKPVSIIIVYLFIVLLMILTIGTFVPMVYENMVRLVASLPAYFENTAVFLQNLPEIGILEFDLWVNALVEAKPWNKLLSNFNTFSLLNSFQYVTSFFSSLFSIFLAFISSVYFLSEFDRIKAFTKRLTGLISSNTKLGFVEKYLKLVDTSFRKFLTCQLLDSLIIGTLTTIEFAMLRSPYALLLGLMLAIANIVPYFGSIIGTVLAVVITGFTNGVESALLTAVVLLITQQLDANIVQPKIIGSSFAISPVLIIIGITIGGSLGGIAGMIFAIPVMNVVKTGLEEYMQKRESLKTTKDSIVSKEI